MNKSILIGAVAGLIFGLILMFFLSGNQDRGFDELIMTVLLGALIGFVGTKMTNFGILGVGALTGAIFYLIPAFLSDMEILPYAITGGVIGLIISLIIKLVMPKLIAKTK